MRGDHLTGVPLKGRTNLVHSLFFWQLHISIQAGVAYVLGKNEVEKCYVQGDQKFRPLLQRKIGEILGLSDGYIIKYSKTDTYGTAT